MACRGARCGGHGYRGPHRHQPGGLQAACGRFEYRETAYRLKPDKERLAAEIGKAAKAAKRIYIATDDDQEGDVIARDVLRFCLDEEDRSRACECA
ncbi:toprim domain-containing protein [Aeromonas veronii]|uniref:toprim domain-containing protein n=1 Tax=Aeromonas veronii TaxID=654 RepID=UPI001F0B59DD|nr:toprim domain-containing protein [Aeromonas veronii]